MAEVHGTFDDRFAGVRDALAAQLDDEELGASIAVDVGGQTVVDIWGGYRDEARTTPWTQDTIVNVWSTTKTITALAVLTLAEKGLLDVHAPVAEYWPEFAANGKDGVLVKHLMAHTSGVAGWDPPFAAEDMYDWESSVARLAAQAPWWEPGTASGYHAQNQGHLLGELVRRVDGRPPAQYVAEEIAVPLGLDLGFGLGADRLERCAELEFDSPDWPARMLGEPGSVHARAVSNPAGARDLAVVNSDLWRTATVPAVNLHATAMAVARFYAAVMRGALPRMDVAQFAGFDHFIGAEVTWGLGVQIEADGSWGMGGLGGNVGWADPSRGLAIAYVTRRLGDFAAVDRIDSALAKS